MVLLAVVIWLRPYFLSIYYLEVGGALLEKSLVPVYHDRLAPEQVIDIAGLHKAVVYLEKSVHLDPRNVHSMRMLGRAYISLGQPEAALGMLKKALTVRPDNPLLHLELGDIYDSLGYTEDVIREYKKGGVGSRSAPLIANYLKLADVQIEIGSGEVAIHLWYETLLMDPNNLYALYRLYKVHQQMGDMEHAAVFKNKILSMDPGMVTVQPDFRLAEYQGQAMAALVEEGIWNREKLSGFVSTQVRRSNQSLPCLITKHLIEVLLKKYPDDNALLSSMDELRHNCGFIY